MNRIPLARLFPAAAARAVTTRRIASSRATLIPTSARALRTFATESTPPTGPPHARPGQPSIQLALNIPPAPPSADVLYPPSPAQTHQPSPAKVAADPDPWDATRTTLQAFWARYGNYVYAYLVWSVVGSLALNVLWTRQEREELEDTTMVKIRKLERELKAIEDEVVAKMGSKDYVHGENMGGKEEAKVESPAAAWYLPWTWFYSSPALSPSSPSVAADSAESTVAQVKVDLDNHAKAASSTSAACIDSNANKAAAPSAALAAGPEQSESLLAAFSSLPSSESAAVRRPRPQVTLY